MATLNTSVMFIGLVKLTCSGVHVLSNAIKQFLKMKNKTAAEFDDKEWRCNFAFLVDIMQYTKI
jgi:hypothetical protein